MFKNLHRDLVFLLFVIFFGIKSVDAQTHIDRWVAVSGSLSQLNSNSSLDYSLNSSPNYSKDQQSNLIDQVLRRMILLVKQGFDPIIPDPAGKTPAEPKLLSYLDDTDRSLCGRYDVNSYREDQPLEHDFLLKIFYPSNDENKLDQVFDGLFGCLELVKNRIREKMPNADLTHLNSLVQTVFSSETRVQLKRVFKSGALNKISQGYQDYITKYVVGNRRKVPKNLDDCAGNMCRLFDFDLFRSILKERNLQSYYSGIMDQIDWNIQENQLGLMIFKNCIGTTVTSHYPRTEGECHLNAIRKDGSIYGFEFDVFKKFGQTFVSTIPVGPNGIDIHLFEKVPEFIQSKVALLSDPKYSWKKCESEFDSDGKLLPYRRPPIPFEHQPNGEMRFIKECAPDTLYAWHDSNFIREFFERKSYTKGNFPVSRGYLHFFRTPIGTFAYGDRAIRVKLREDVKYVYFKHERNSSVNPCTIDNMATDKNNVYVSDRYRFVDYIICTMEPIESISYLLPQHLEEMRAEKQWVKTHVRGQYDEYYYAFPDGERGHLYQSSDKTFFGFYIDRSEEQWTEAKLDQNLKFFEEEMVKKSYFVWHQNFEKFSMGEMIKRHFQTRVVNYWSGE